MIAEVSYIEQKCKENGIPKPISFAYPGNRSDSLSQVVLKEMGYKYIRAGNSQYLNLAEPTYVLPSFTMASTEKLKIRSLNALKNLKDGEALIFTIHGVPDIAHPDYTTDPEFLEELLQYIKSHDYQVIAMKDLDKYL